MALASTTRLLLSLLMLTSVASGLAGCVTHPGVRYAHERDQALAKKHAREMQAFANPKHRGSEAPGHALPHSTEQESLARAEQANRRALHEYQRLSRKQAAAAYRSGVQDTMHEFKGRLNAQQGFVWQKPLVDTVYMPSRVVNGALVPAHNERVIISPGRWVEHNDIALPGDQRIPSNRSQHHER